MSTAELDPLFARVPVLAGRSCSVAELGGGLTNRNLRVTDRRRRRLRRADQLATSPSLLAIDRDNERHNTRAAWEAGVGAPGRRGAAGRQRPRRRLPPGTHARAGRHARPGVRAAHRGGRPRLHAGPAFQGTFDMRAIRRRYLTRGSGARLPLARRLPRPRPARRAPRGRDASRRPEPLVPCNNDLLAANFIDDGDEDLDHRLRVLGHERGELRARQHRERVRSSTRADHGRCSSRRTGARRRGSSWPARRPGRCWRGTAGRCGPRSRTASRRSTSTSGRGAWRSTTLPAPSCSARRTPELPATGLGAPMTLTLPDRAQRVVVIGGGVGGTRIAHHLAERGETDVAPARPRPS